MLTAGRSLTLSHKAGEPLPRVAELQDLYDPHKGPGATVPRRGELIMIAGRSGSQKSGFAMWWVAKMGLPTVYFSADMRPFTASSRLACLVAGETTEQVEWDMRKDSRRAAEYMEMLAELPITFSFGTPITWRQVDEEIEAYVELWNAYPDVLVFDNLMDFEGAESDYEGQMATMQGLTELSRELGSTVIVLHHASDKSWDAKTQPWYPPSRDQVKGGLSEKPELSLSVALEPVPGGISELNLATIKARMGPSDPTAKKFVSLKCEPDKTRFHCLSWKPETKGSE